MKIKHDIKKLIKKINHVFPINGKKIQPKKSGLSFNNDTLEFEYSQKWYDQSYHLGRIETNKKNFIEIENMYRKTGYHNRFETVFSKIPIPSYSVDWLEVGCHLGLTSFWIKSRYPKVNLFMFDFSEESIKWCKREFPFRDTSVIWQTSVENIELHNNNLTNQFDFITCIDVTEHLPDLIYKKMISELFRVCKAGGKIILMQGIAPNIEHIHVLEEEQLINDFLSAGFKLINRLPHRHYLFQK